MAEKLIKQARLILGEFENSNDNKKKEKFLDDALSCLSEVIEKDFPEEKKKVAKNMMFSYRNYVFEQVDELIKGPNFIDEDIVLEWFSLLNKFDEYGFGNDDEYKKRIINFVVKIRSVIGTGRTID